MAQQQAIASTALDRLSALTARLAGSRPLSATAARTLAAEVTRHPGPKTVVVLGDDRALVDVVVKGLYPADHLTVVAPDAGRAKALSQALADDGALQGIAASVDVTDVLPSAGLADAVIVGTPVSGEDAARDEVAAARTLAKTDGVVTVFSPASPAASAALVEAGAACGVRSDLVLRNLPPLRVHHLRFGAADPALAERLAPAFSPSSVQVTDRLAVDSNGIAAVAVLAGAALLARRARPKSRLWLLPAAATVPALAFFRDPRRITPDDPRSVVAAADGTVLSVQRLTDERFGPGEWLRIAVFLSITDVHVNRSPVAGRVVDVIAEDGGYADARTTEAEHNVALYTVLDTVHGRTVVAQRTGLVARRIVQRARVGALLSRGERFGLIRFGSRTDVYVPAEAAEPSVAPGERVVGGETVVARWR